MASKERNQARRDAFRASGMCVECGKKPAQPGYVRCDYHLEYARTRHRAWHKRYPTKSGLYTRRARRKRIALGICSMCTKPLMPTNRWFCKYHYEYMKAWQYERARPQREIRAKFKRNRTIAHLKEQPLLASHWDEAKEFIENNLELFTDTTDHFINFALSLNEEIAHDEHLCD